MVLDSTTIDKKRPLFYSRAERLALGKNLEIPRGTAVWLGRSLIPHLRANSTGAYYMIHKPIHVHRSKEPHPGHVSTIVVGNLALQVLTVNAPAEYSDGGVVVKPSPGPWDHLLIGIWPPSRQQYWPPPLAFDTHIPMLHIGLLTNRWKMGRERVIF
jgi:hypothetical protein